MPGRTERYADVVFLAVRPDLTPRHQLFARELTAAHASVALIGPRGQDSELPPSITIRDGLPGPAGMGWAKRLIHAVRVIRRMRTWQARLWIITHPALLPCAGSRPGRYVYDVTEFWDLELRQRLGRLAAAVPPVWNRVERWALENVDLVTVVDSRNGWLTDRYRAWNCDVESVFNVPAKADDPPAAPRIDACPGLVYVGGIRRSKGLEAMLRALAHCGERYPNAVLRLVGPLLEDPRWFHKTLDELGIADRVSVNPTVPYPVLLQLLQGDLIAMALSERNAISRHVGVGNGRKLFTYMQAGLPTVISEHAPGAEVVRRAACGMIVDERDSESVARAVSAYADDPVLRREHGHRARELFEQCYCWEIRGQRVSQRLRALAGLPSDDLARTSFPPGGEVDESLG